MKNVTVAQIVWAWQRFLGASSGESVVRMCEFKELMFQAAAEVLPDSAPAPKSRVWQLSDAHRLLDELSERRPTCDECITVTGSATAPKPTHDGWVSRDILGDIMTFHCRKCSRPEYPWAHFGSAERLLDWMRANPREHLHEYEPEEIRRALVG